MQLRIETAGAKSVESIFVNAKPGHDLEYLVVRNMRQCETQLPQT